MQLKSLWVISMPGWEGGGVQIDVEEDSLHEARNDNRLWIINFANAKNLIIVSTYFLRKNIHKQTWTSSNGKTKNLIDHVLIRKKHSSKIMSVHVAL